MAAPSPPSDDDPGERAPRARFALIGFLEGLSWWWAFESARSSGASLWFCLAFPVTGAALVARFTWDGRALRRWGALTAGFGAAVAAVTGWVWSELPPDDAPYMGDAQRIAAWALGAFVLLYVTVPFAQIFQGSGRLRFPYPQLFVHSWNNFFVGLVAAFFTGAFWALLAVWGALFRLIGISLFADLFQSPPFASLATFTVFGYGLAIGRASEGVIRSLRRITLLAAQALLPLVALIALLFLAALPFTGLDPLWRTGSATPLVLTLLGLLALLLNGVFEEGREPPGYPRAVVRAIEAAVLVMPAYAAIALYGTGLRVAQHGLTPQRVYALLFVGVASVYALGYAVAVVLRRPPWIATLRSVNVGAALLLAALAVLVQLPWLDPLRLSAENQAARLRQQRVRAEDFDFATLRFGLGHHGWRVLEELERLEGHPESARIARSIERVRAARSLDEARRPSEAPDLFAILPRGASVPEPVLDAIRRDFGFQLRSCAGEDGCLVLVVDLDRDGAPEHCAMAGSLLWKSRCYASRPDGTLRRIGSLGYRGASPRPSRLRLEVSLGTEARTQPSRFEDLVVPGGVLELVPPDADAPLD